MTVPPMKSGKGVPLELSPLPVGWGSSEKTERPLRQKSENMLSKGGFDRGAQQNSTAPIELFGNDAALCSRHLPHCSVQTAAMRITPLAGLESPS